ncbi:uncharacterized protein CCR75_001525 [Bremia lactucae]|uniref:Uncharacterized protein n=1 Tax=Bremia lactucae TaxID=4779 RepID=A0A976IB07_BRELC|nr:hypothetical protein CCR75_001525 [Bremia lactucae]
MFASQNIKGIQQSQYQPHQTFHIPFGNFGQATKCQLPAGAPVYVGVAMQQPQQHQVFWNSVAGQQHEVPKGVNNNISHLLNPASLDTDHSIQRGIDIDAFAGLG